jgi:hypothetical protein
MGHPAQFQGAPQVGQVGQQLGDAAVIGLEEDFQDEASEPLRLRILLGAERVGVVAQGQRARTEGAGQGELTLASP